MSMISAHAPAPQACRPVDQTQCSTCMLSYNCRTTAKSGVGSWGFLALALVLATGLVLRLAGAV